MAKVQKYSEDQLLTAVVKFSEIEKKKIKATELAKWCRENMVGLEEVRDYHFTRSIKELDNKSGKMVERSYQLTSRLLSYLAFCQEDVGGALCCCYFGW